MADADFVDVACDDAVVASTVVVDVCQTDNVKLMITILPPMKLIVAQLLILLTLLRVISLQGVIPLSPPCALVHWT